ncbi:response regulator [Acidobacteriota bacterium]
MNKNILLIEDNEKHSFIMEDMLSDEDYKVEIAKDGGEVRQIMAEKEKSGKLFDLILVDIAVPDFDAVKFITKYRVSYRIIVVSAYADHAPLNGILEEKWVIRKPFDNYVFLERVRERLNLPI